VAEPPAPPLDVDGPAAPPRRNGELVFDAPWQSRLFGLTIALHRAGLFAWDDFRARLIAAIAAAPEDPYWRAWQRAFESLLATKAVCTGADVDRRTHALAARPAGHDHPH
jgi:nitrile hydratase accessory protein